MTTDLQTRLSNAFNDVAEHVTVTEDSFARITSRAAASRPDRTRRFKLAGVACAIALVALGLAIVGQDNDTPVYAGWTPVPRAATSDETGAVVNVCNARTTDSNGDLPANAFNAASHVEVRGRIALALQLSADGLRYYHCTAEQQDDGWYAFTLGAMPSVGDAKPVIEGGGGPGNFTSILFGQSTAAASIELDLPGFPTATAPVNDGLYGIWFPTDTEAGSDGLPVLELRLLDENGRIIDTINW